MIARQILELRLPSARLLCAERRAIGRQLSFQLIQGAMPVCGGQPGLILEAIPPPLSWRKKLSCLYCLFYYPAVIMAKT
jgi:hypothetical protein